MVQLYNTEDKTYEIPFDKFDSLLEELELTLRKEIGRSRTLAGIFVRKKGQTSRYEGLDSSRQTRNYVNVRSLRGKEIALWMARSTNGRLHPQYNFDDYLVFRKNGKCVLATVKANSGFTCNPEVIDDVVERHSLNCEV